VLLLLESSLFDEFEHLSLWCAYPLLGDGLLSFYLHCLVVACVSPAEADRCVTHRRLGHVDKEIDRSDLVLEGRALLGLLA